jgi:hypothetical protein
MMRTYEESAVASTSLEESGVKRIQELPVEAGWLDDSGMEGCKMAAKSFIRLTAICPFSYEETV